MVFCLVFVYNVHAMTQEQKKNNLIGLVILIVIIGAVFYFKPNKIATPEEIQEIPIVEENNNTEEETKTENNSAEEPVDQYKILINAGHKAYLKNNYTEALNYFNQALKLQQNDRIYRSIYLSGDGQLS